MSKQTMNLASAMNAYRTKKYIVKQELKMQFDKCENPMIVSRDTYYLRTEERDLVFEFNFCNRKNIDGKRLRANSFVRTYVD